MLRLTPGDPQIKEMDNQVRTGAMENFSDAMAAFSKGILNDLVFINMILMRVGYGLDWPLDETNIT